MTEKIQKRNKNIYIPQHIYIIYAVFFRAHITAVPQALTFQLGDICIYI